MIFYLKFRGTKLNENNYNKKVKDFFPSREAVKEIRNSLEQKTEKDFRDFARSKQNVREQAHIKLLD